MFFFQVYCQEELINLVEEAKRDMQAEKRYEWAEKFQENKDKRRVFYSISNLYRRDACAKCLQQKNNNCKSICEW